MAYTDKEKDKAKRIIIEGLYDGLSLKKIIEENKEVPSRPIVYSWLNDASSKYDAEFLNNYLRAREDSSDIDSDKIEDLNQELRDKKIDAQTARVIADNLKWTAGKKRPKKYGDRTEVEHSGEIKTKDLSSYTTEELRLRAEYMKAAGSE